MKNIKFISFEGGEGSGKSSQAQLLFKSLNKSNKVYLTREPGGTKLSEKIRKLLVNKGNFSIDPLTELLLINASRNEHIKNIILPKLGDNYTLICDRFLDSTFAYQVFGHGLDEKIFKDLNNLIVKSCIPTMTFLIDIPPSIGLKRSLKINEKENRFENFNVSFHERVRKGFKILAKNTDRIHLINGKKSINSIHREIIDKINKTNFFKNKLKYILND